jgi:hypothetical protein
MNKIANDVCQGLEKSMTKYPLFHSPHEGYGVILEELDELWDEVKKRKPDKVNMRAEAVQVAAMAMKFIMSMANGWKPERKPKDDINCRICGWQGMTEEERDELGCDPCLDCRDESNWKPKEAGE